MARWTENEFASYLARNGLKDCCVMSDKEGCGKGPQNRRQGYSRLSEHEEQKRLIAHCREMEAAYPELALLHAIPNGGARHVVVAKKLKAEGVRSGIPDLFLPVSRGMSHGLYIELKSMDGKVSENQHIMLNALEKQGYTCVVAYGWEKAWAEIEGYLKTEKVYFLSQIFNAGDLE